PALMGARVVMKFGGTSVADPEAIGRLIAIVREARGRDGVPPVVVVSALSGVTDRLVEIARLAEEGNGEGAASMLAALADRHVSVATAVTTRSRGPVVERVRRELAETAGLVHALAVLREVSPRSRDAVHA